MATSIEKEMQHLGAILEGRVEVPPIIDSWLASRLAVDDNRFLAYVHTGTHRLYGIVETKSRYIADGDIYIPTLMQANIHPAEAFIANHNRTTLHYEGGSTQDLADRIGIPVMLHDKDMTVASVGGFKMIIGQGIALSIGRKLWLRPEIEKYLISLPPNHRTNPYLAAISAYGLTTFVMDYFPQLRIEPTSYGVNAITHNDPGFLE